MIRLLFGSDLWLHGSLPREDGFREFVSGGDAHGTRFSVQAVGEQLPEGFDASANPAAGFEEDRVMAARINS